MSRGSERLAGRALGMTPEFRLNLRRMYDLDQARASPDVSRIKPLVATGWRLPRLAHERQHRC